MVPIPYDDKNADSSFGELHCEGGEYPDSIGITRLYDISSVVQVYQERGKPQNVEIV